MSNSSQAYWGGTDLIGSALTRCQLSPKLTVFISNTQQLGFKHLSVSTTTKSMPVLSFFFFFTVLHGHLVFLWEVHKKTSSASTPGSSQISREKIPDCTFGSYLLSLLFITTVSYLGQTASMKEFYLILDTLASVLMDTKLEQENPGQWPISYWKMQKMVQMWTDHYTI